jgi:hypothetical protein
MQAQPQSATASAIELVWRLLQQWLLNAVSGMRRKPTPVAADYGDRSVYRLEDDFRVELERRFMGQ